MARPIRTSIRAILGSFAFGRAASNLRGGGACVADIFFSYTQRAGRAKAVKFQGNCSPAAGGGMVRGLRTDCLAAAGAVSLYGGGPWSAGSDDGADRGVEPSTPFKRSLGQRSDKSRTG